MKHKEKSRNARKSRETQGKVTKRVEKYQKHDPAACPIFGLTAGLYIMSALGGIPIHYV